ncbi:hypothetical protein V9T40_005442 [Parthenolecanium corni]|uniref:Uncharacterized protein n=1 Tax=Parthenolecanium corni TaxID=536013 RepID=A0AAN9TEN4_9HEMI
MPAPYAKSSSCSDTRFRFRFGGAARSDPSARARARARASASASASASDSDSASDVRERVMEIISTNTMSITSCREIRDSHRCSEIRTWLQTYFKRMHFQ